MNVLILSDFSEVAINATHYAMDLLQNEEVNFTLLNIYVPNREVSEEAWVQKRKAIKAKMEERLKKLKTRSSFRMHNILSHYSEQPLVNATRIFMEKHNVDLLVMGSVGKNFRYSTILGNHTYEIMTKIKCNVLAIPEDVHFKSLERILMPLDYTASLKRENFQFLKNERWFRNTRLHVWELGSETSQTNSVKNYVAQQFGGIEIDFFRLNDFKNINKIIWNEVQKSFNLVVVLGKNLEICEQLMHRKHGLFTSNPNRIPILILHD